MAECLAKNHTAAQPLHQSNLIHDLKDEGVELVLHLQSLLACFMIISARRR